GCPVHGGFDGGQRCGVLAEQGSEQVHGAGENLGFGGGGVDQSGGQGLRAAEPVAGGHGGHRGLGAEFGLDECGHTGGEGNIDIDLGETVVAAVVAHDAVIVGDGQHGAGAERVAVDGGDSG